MYPACMWRDSYPHHTDSRTKEISSHMKMDLSPPNPLYQPWPYGGNYCYPPPQEYHGCCNHGYYGGGLYSFWPNYTHYPPPPPAFHTHGFYPPFPGTYPGYSVPPPHYSVDQPRYDYDKNNHAPHHCCGCNHREDEKKMRIEEEPKVDKKTSESLVPFLLKDCPSYPIMWVPPGYMNNTQPKAKEEDKNSDDPVSLKLPEPSKQIGNGEMTQGQQGEGDGSPFPFQIFWLPQVRKDSKENNLDLLAHKGLPDEKTRKNDEGSGSEADCETSSLQKVIQVKQGDTNEEKQNLENVQMKVKTGSVVDKKPDNGSREGKASPKTSKLPPVCLRIDPLPRKKKSSRSPSPPGDKQRSNGSPVNSFQQQTQLTEGLKASKEELSKDDIKAIEVTNDVATVEKDNFGGEVPREEGNDVTKVNKGNLGVEVPREEGNGGRNGMVQGKGEHCEGIKKNLSEHEAARIIQSVYRGFEVRKSQPLMKLRQIGDVGKQVFELRDWIKDLELSSSTMSIDDKQKLIIGETIMSLLLKLDTIQGLHPFVRDIRKSVATELVGLQEKLDSLTSVKSETLSAISMTEQVMHPEDDPIQEKSDQGQTLSGLCKNHEHQVTESQYDYDDAEACNTNLEPQSEFHRKDSKGDDGIQEKLHHAPNQIMVSDTIISESHEMKATESQDGGAESCNTNGEQQLDSHNDKSEYDEVVELDTFIFDNHEVVATNSVDNGSVEAHDIKNPEQLVEQNTGELNNQLKMSVETEQTANYAVQDLTQTESDGTDIEILMSDACDGNHTVDTVVPPANDGVCDMIMEEEKSDQTEAQFESVDDDNVHAVEASKVDEVKDDGGVGSHGKLMEEKEKLRVVVEELRKAGNEQLEVIKELTGRVKDLEKKLSRKKKIKVNKCRSRSYVVKEEIRDCLV